MTQATQAFPDICQDTVTVSLLADLDAADVRSLLARYGLKLTLVHETRAIPGSYWGDSEAGLVGNELLARIDTPIHSILHSARPRSFAADIEVQLVPVIPSLIHCHRTLLPIGRPLYAPVQLRRLGLRDTSHDLAAILLSRRARPPAVRSCSCLAD